MSAEWLCDPESVLDRLTALVGPVEIRYPETAEVSRDDLRSLIAVAKAAHRYRIAHMEVVDLRTVNCFHIAMDELDAALATLLTRDSDA